MTKKKKEQGQKQKQKQKQKKGAASIVVVAKKDRLSDRDSSEADANTASSSDAQMAVEFSYQSVVNYEAMNYKSNCHINVSEKLMLCPISKENSEQQDEYYNRLRWIYHQNILRLEEPALEGGQPHILDSSQRRHFSRHTGPGVYIAL